MAEQAYAYVTLIPVAKGFQSAVAKELSGVEDIGDQTGKKTGSKFAGGFGGPLKSLALAAGSAFAAIGVGQFFSDSIKQASDLGESVNAVNKSYGDFADDVLKLGGDVANRLGLSTVDFNQAAVRFSSFAGKIAGQGGDVAGVVDTLTTRAADFASVYNIEVSEALAVFQSGLSGEAEPLKRFGINLLDSEVKAYAYANGIAQVGAELTETEKVQARAGLLLQETAKTAGDFADTSDGLANSQRILRANLENLQATVGAGLTPVMATFTSALVPIANVIFPAIANFINNFIAPGLQRAADAFKAFASSAGEGGATLTSIFDGIRNGLVDFIEGGGIARIIERMAEFRMQFFDAISKALPGIIDAFMTFIPQMVQFLVSDLLPALVEALIGVIGQLAQVIVDLAPLLIEALFQIIPELLTAAITLFESLIDALVEITPMLIDTIIELLPIIVKSLVDMFPRLLDAGLKFFLALVEAVVDATPLIIDAVVKLVPVIVDGLIKAIPQLIDAGIQLLAGLAKGMIDNAPRILATAVVAVGETLVNGVKDFLGIRSPSKVFETIGDNVGEGLVKGINNSKSKVSAAAKELSKASIPPGFEWVEGPNGPYLEMSAFVSGKSERGVSDFGAASASFLLRQQGLNQKEIDNVLRNTIGGTLNQVNATMNRGVTLINEATNTMVMGNLGAADIAAKVSEGYAVVEKIATPVEDLEKAIGDLIQTIQTGGTSNLTPMADGGFVTGPTRALVGEAGPEVVIPLDRFETMMGMGGAGKTVNYYAAPNQSIDAEQSLFQAMRRAKVVANW